MNGFVEAIGGPEALQQLIWGSIGGLALIAAGVVAVVLERRKQKLSFGAPFGPGLARIGAAFKPKPRAVKVKVEREPPPEKNWGWFLGQVQEAKGDRGDNLMHPRMAMRNPGALARHYRRWKGMTMASSNAGMAKVYTMPMVAYKECMIRVFGTERRDFVQPHIPTALVSTWRPKAALADQPRKWRTESGRPAFDATDSYMWLALEPGQLVDDLLQMSDFDAMENDDYKMQDIINVERRALNRGVQAAGFLEGEVDQPPTETASILIELIPHGTGIGLALLGILMLLVMRG